MMHKAGQEELGGCAKVNFESSFSDWCMVLYNVLVCPAQHECDSGIFATSTQQRQSQNVDNNVIKPGGVNHV